MDDPKSSNKSTLPEKLIATWLKHDPFVKLIAKDNNQIRYDAMLALAGESAAQKFFSASAKLNPPPALVFPSHVRAKEREFLSHSDRRSRIIHELVYWGRDEYLNQENPDSYLTRIQIIHSLLGPLFLNADASQEKLIVDGVKVLVISRETGLGKYGEQSPLVHTQILGRLSDLLSYNHLVIQGKQAHQAEQAIRTHLIKTIQGLKDHRHRSAYYLADDLKHRQKLIAQKFPLSLPVAQGLLEIVTHYAFSAWPEFRRRALGLLNQLGEKPKAKLPQPRT